MPKWKLALAKLAAAIPLFILGPTRVFGRKNVPRQGGVLVLANHLSSLDPVLVQWACPRPVFFMAEVELFEMPGVRVVAKAWQAFPVKQDAPDRAALRRAIELLRQGQVVCVFPEGGLSPTEALGEFKRGVALIARQWNGAILPLHIDGSRRAIPYGSMRPRPAFRWITLRWGAAANPPVNDEARFLTWLRTELETLA
jgi:1-acyl-sn-glycerol-3-phosphate acyltransferase